MKNLLYSMVIALIILTSLTACENEKNNANSQTISTTQTSAKNTNLISSVQKAVEKGMGKNDKILNISFKKKKLSINIKLESSDIVDARSLAISRASSITDAILEINGINKVKTILVTFDGIGSVKRNISDALNEGYGPYFEINDLD